MYIFRLVFSFSSDIYSAEELLDHIVVLVLVYWGTFILLLTVAASSNIPTNCIQGFPFLHILVNICSKRHFFKSWWFRIFRFHVSFRRKRCDDYIVEINFKNEFLKSTMKPHFSRDVAETGKITTEN